MASSKWADSRFGERLKDERGHRRLTQPQLAKLLAEKGIKPMHATTIAKIEAGTRSVRINEAVGIADLLGVSLDSLLGHRHTPDLEDLTNALSDAVVTSRIDLRRHAKTLADRMADIPNDEALAGLVGDALGHLDAAGMALDRLVEHFIQHVKQQVAEDVVKKLKDRKTRDKA
jgi:transcriptional regulator with XRE-family HTH domain